MSKIALYSNANCPDCVRQGKRTAWLDWLGRVELLTEESPVGEVAKGEIVVVDKQSGKVFTGIYAVRKVCMQIPLLVPLGLVLYIPPVRKMGERKKPGCDGDACEV